MKAKVILTKTYSKLCQTSNVERFPKAVNGFQLLIILEKAPSQMFDKVLYTPLSSMKFVPESLT